MDSSEGEQKAQSAHRLEGVNEWTLEPNAEFRFELEKGSNLAIKVCVIQWCMPIQL